MAYCFKREESVSKAVRRLGRERIEHALDCLKDSDRAEAVHCARKDIKKVRAVLRLVHTRIPKKKFRRLTGGLREAATHLAPSRDAHIKAQILRKLAVHFKAQLAPGALRGIRAPLRKTAAQEMRRFVKEKTAGTVESILRREMTAFQRLKVGGKGWRGIGRGVKAAYRQGRRAYRAVEGDSSPENLHAWRKRVKDLWYHVRLLHPVWPEQMEAIAHELEALGKTLGDDHDLAMLKQDVEKRFIGRGHDRELEALNALIEQRHGELRAAALALGARFYAEKPSIFCNRLAGYWKTWRRVKRPVSQHAAANG
jgi:CHAD domain-containing protein